MAVTAITVKSWSMDSQSASTWTDLVAGTAAGESVKAIIVSNPGAGAANVSVRVADSGGTSEAVILPSTSVAAGAAMVLDCAVLNLTASQKLQIYSSTTDVEFYASGVSYA